MLLKKKQMQALTLRRGAGGEDAQGVDFDGTNDFLTRGSDLTGNVNDKEGTFCFFGYRDSSGSTQTVYDAAGRFTIAVNASNQLTILGVNTSGSTILSATVTSPLIPENTFFSVLTSWDLSYPANRWVYISDELATVTWSTYTSGTIDHTGADHGIGAEDSGANKWDGRLCHIYLDYVDRDISVEATRRLFVAADGKPANGLASLSPILYLPMDDPTAPGRNDGTGGNFTLTGTVARSGRGPNQYNVPACVMDGAADYVSGSYSNSYTPTVTFSLSIKKNSTNEYVCSIDPGGNSKFSLQAGSTGLTVRAWNSSNVSVLYVITATTSGVVGKWFNIQGSFDLSDTGKRHVIINGVEQSLTVIDYVDDNMYFTGNLNYGALNGGAIPFDGEMGSFWLDETYINLSADNPFYDAFSGKLKALGTTGELPTGSSPLVYLPFFPDDAGANAGTGSDLTVYSGPFSGARGPSEAWLNSVEFDGSAERLSRGADLTGNANSKLVMGILAVKRDGTGAEVVWDSSGQFRLAFDASNYLVITGKDTGGNTDLSVRTSAIADTNWHVIQFAFDMGNASNRHIYVDGSSDLTVTTYNDDTLDFTAADHCFGAVVGGGSEFDGRAALWLGFGEYQDISSEAVRLLSVDAFGYPTNWGSTGSLITGSAPLVYMTKSDGTNSGTGGSFSVTSTPADGGHVKG